MTFIKYMNAARELQSQNNDTLLGFYREAFDRHVVRIAQLEREIAELSELADRGKSMAEKQRDGISRLIGELQITTIEWADGDTI